MKVTTKTLFKRLIADTNGNFATMWAVAMMGIMIAIGGAYDLSQFTKAKAIAQYTADNMALAASIAVDRDNADRFEAHPVTYSYTEIGAAAADFTGSMRGSVEYDIVDTNDTGNTGLPDSDKTRLLARATITGTYRPAFMSMFPKFAALDFTATSDVAYSNAEGTPASIFFAVDNSGSMEWDDDDGEEKLGSLKDSMQDFMTVLDGIDTDGNNLFRTALYPYSQDYYQDYGNIDDDGVIPAHVVDPQWGKMNNGNITQMQLEAGTDSSGAMEDAATAFTLENAIHAAENGQNTPLKFMVFMSDGANNESYECQTQSVWVPGSSEHWWKWERFWIFKWKVYEYSEPADSWNWTYVAGTDGEYQDQQVCAWDYWADIQTKASCDAMKDDGVTIYSIGYALSEGIPQLNGSDAGYWWWGWWYTYYTSQAEVDRAQSLLSYCATDASHYILAQNAEDLNEVLLRIGDEIVSEVIRVKH